MLGGGDGRPRAILFRQIATPNYELRRFLRLCSRSGYTPVILQYHTDRMSCQNAFKRSLVAPMFLDGINRNGQPIFRRHHLINVETVEKLRLSEVTVSGRTLPDLHADLLQLAIPKETFRTVDGSSLFGSYSAGARDYYVDLFVALTGGLILFEDFLTDAKEADFFARVVLPAFDAACKILGHRPMISKLCDNRRMPSPLWYAYPASYRAHFAALGCRL
ncbi:hypothetical protein MCELHM10_03434 [Paracoccaceae bacterium]